MALAATYPNMVTRPHRTALSVHRGGGGCSVDRAMASRLGRRVVVLDVETERFGRTYAGKEGRILMVSRDPETMVFSEYVVDVGDNPAGVPFKPNEVRFLD